MARVTKNKHVQIDRRTLAFILTIFGVDYRRCRKKRKEVGGADAD